MRALEWLRITWLVILIATALVGVGLFLMAAAEGIGQLVGLLLVLFGGYWGYRGTRADPE